MLSKTVSNLKRTLLCVSMFASLGAVALPTSAAVVHIVENGILMGANNVDVDGTKYDVRFVDGSYYNIFPQNKPFIWNESHAFSVSQSLLDTVFLDLSVGDFGSVPSLTNGCSDPYRCLVKTPILRGTFVLAGFDYVGISNAEVVFTNYRQGAATYGLASDSMLDIYSSDNGITWAVWSPSVVSAVPEPSTYAIMGLGLLGVIEMARRRQNQALAVMRPY